MKISALLLTSIMKYQILALIGVALILPATASAQGQLFHYKATGLFPIQTEEPDPNPKAVAGATIIKKITLGTKEMINLALGTPLNTVNKDIVLAVELEHGAPNNTKLVVGRVITNPDHTKSVYVLATLITLLDPVDVNISSKNVADPNKQGGTGNGLTRGRILATTLGTPATDGLLQTDICGAATGGLASSPVGPTFKFSMTSILGPIQGKIEGVPLDGLIIKGSFSSGGKPIDHF